MKIIFIILCLLWLYSLVFANDPDVKYGQKSYVKIHPINFRDSIETYIKYWAFLPPEYIESKSTILTDKEILFSLDVYYPREANLYIDSLSKIPFYLIPQDTVEISIDFSYKNNIEKAVTFSGKNSSISRYIFERNISIPYRFGMEGAKLRSSNLSLNEVLVKMDSLQNIETKFLDDFNNKNLLPEWFYKTEKWSIIYAKAERKAIIPGYRKDMLQRNELIPENYYSFWESLPLKNPEAKFSYEYFFYLSSYFFNNFLDEKYKWKDKPLLFTGMFELYPSYCDSLLSPVLSDIYLSFELANVVMCGFIDLYDSVMSKDNLKFHNEKIFQILDNYRKNKYAIKAGEEAFNFYLPDEDSHYFELKDFRNNVVLLNFWFPGCTPCIIEMPYEKNLVTEFAGKNFVLINICMNNTPKEVWQNSIKKYDLHGINLWTNENWVKLLTRNYTIAGFPKYVLINKDGIIINPSAQRPSRGIVNEIKKYVD